MINKTFFEKEEGKRYVKKENRKVQKKNKINRFSCKKTEKKPCHNSIKNGTISIGWLNVLIVAKTKNITMNQSKELTYVKKKTIQ